MIHVAFSEVNSSTHASGVVDVVVTSNGQTGRLTGGFTYKAPAQTTNTPPVVKSIVAKGTRPSEPSQFADLDEEIAITATVEDADTPISQLTFEWSAPTGTFTGQGASVTWKAPAQFTTPAPVTVSLVVTEKYQTTDDSGLPVDKENKVTSSSIVQLHVLQVVAEVMEERVEEATLGLLFLFSRNDLARRLGRIWILILGGERCDCHER